MTLRNKIESLEIEKKHIQEDFLTIDRKLKKYRNLHTLDASLFFSDISLIKTLKTQETKYFSIEISNDEKEVILGGDGRSKPWSTAKTQHQAIISSKYYITDYQKDMMKTHLNYLGYLDDVFFKFK